MRHAALCAAAGAAFVLAPAARAVDVQYIGLPTIVVIYTDYVNAADGVEMHISPAEVELLQEEVGIAQRFLWRSSHLRCLMDPDWLVVSRPLTPEQIPHWGENACWLGFWSADGVHSVQQDLYDAGIVNGQYSVVLVLYAFANSANHWAMVGGGTYGPDVGCMGDASYVACPLAWGLEARWVVIHEYLHAVDALFYWTNPANPAYDSVMHSADNPITFPHVIDCGEHFNFLISATIPPTHWLWIAPHWADHRFAADADGDGVPDGGDLPLTEVTLGTSTANDDSDGDGLPDLDELLAAYYQAADPLGSDSDGDGALDGADAYPLVQFNDYLPRRAPALDGTVAPGEYVEVAQVNGTDPDLSAVLWATWYGDRLYVAAEVRDDQRSVAYDPGLSDHVQIRIDVEQDGWLLHGTGNYQLCVIPDGRPNQCYAHLYAVYHDPGNPDSHDLAVTGLQRWYTKWSGGYTVEIGIPAALCPGLTMGPAARVRFSCGVHDADEWGSWTTWNFFSGHTGDRWAFVELVPAPRTGDSNCDGYVGFADIDPFVAALAGPAVYGALMPDCDWRAADCNGDGLVTFGDIDPFVALIGS